MIKGYLRIAVLNELLKGPKTGYSLISALEDELGKRPSSGSMYPLLRQLEEESMIRSSKEGRKINYRVTQKGRNSIAKLLKDKREFVEKHIEVCRSMNELAGSRMQKDEVVCAADRNVLRNIDLFHDFKDNVVRILGSRSYKRLEPKFRKELEETNKRLKRLR